MGSQARNQDFRCWTQRMEGVQFKTQVGVIKATQRTCPEVWKVFTEGTALNSLCFKDTEVL